MAFPIDPLPIKGELFINGAWVDITKDIRGDESIQISNRGTPNEGSSLSSSVCAFKLNNGVSKVTGTAEIRGVYSNRNPRSPYFGLLPQNVPFRVSVDYENTSSLISYGPNVTQSYVQTPDKAALDVVGDLDLRTELNPSTWMPYQGTYLAVKYATGGNQRSWYWTLGRTGKLQFAWTTDGTIATRLVANSTVPVPPESGRLAIRVVLDVNNGSGGWTATFYTAPSMSGTWTQLGATVSGTGVTSIFSGSAALNWGFSPNGALSDANGNAFVSPRGVAYDFEMRNGIGGTVVAKAAFNTLTSGTTTWFDGTGTNNQWTVIGDSMEIVRGSRRFVGEIAQLPVEWEGTGQDVWVRVQANDITRRLTQGRDPLESSLKRYIMSSVATLGGITGYWPAEDGFDATQIASVIGKPAQVVDVSFGVSQELPSSSGAVTFNSANSQMSGAPVITSATSTNHSFVFVYDCPVRPTDYRTMFYVRSTGTIRRWEISISTTTMKVRGYDASGTLIVDQPFTDGTEPNLNFCMVALYLEQSGGSVNWTLYLTDLTEAGGFGSASGTITGTVGRFSSWQSGQHAELANFSFAHIFTARNTDNSAIFTAPFLLAARAFEGELAATRLRRLAQEAGVRVDVHGIEALTEAMGPQRPDLLFNLFKECADVDGGILFSPREFLGYRYRTRNSMINQQVLALDYSGDDLSTIKLTDDDQNLRNDVTVKRQSGSSARSVKETGSKSVLPPEQGGAGRYSTSVTLNAYLDSRLQDLADYAVFMGTWDEARYPELGVQLERANFINNPTKFATVVKRDVGDALGLVNLPDFLPPGPVDLLMRGVKEVLSNRGWAFTWNSSPYGPYRANDLMQTTNSRNRAAASNSVTATALTAGQDNVLFNVTTATGKLWGNTAKKPGNFPLDIMIAGERITIVAIFGGTATQVFQIPTGGRGKNGLTKALPIGSPVQIAEPFNVAL